MNEEMKFPETFEQFAKEYGFKDNEEVYTNGSALIQIFRVKQWLEHQMTVEEYRQRMIQAFHNADCDGLIAVCVLPTEKEFEHLEWLLKNHYKKEPCEDAISRQKAIDAIDVLYLDGDSPASYLANAEGDTLIGKYQAITALDDLSSVTPQPKTGHWEWVQYDSNPNIGNWHCSECRCVVVECVDKKPEGGIPLYKYCPQCGCRIVESEESEGEG